jgi:hypothetical protein
LKLGKEGLSSSIHDGRISVSSLASRDNLEVS